MGLDRHLDRWVVEHRVGVLDPVFVFLTNIGRYGVVWLAIALVGTLLWKRTLLLWVLAADLIAEGATRVLKDVFDRDRPPLHYPTPEPLIHTPLTHSFPSGHAATSFACATVLAAVRPQLRWPFFFLAALIAWSRVYVGVHYPLDVLAGSVIGLGIGYGVVTALRRHEAGPRRSRPAPRAG